MQENLDPAASGTGDPPPDNSGTGTDAGSSGGDATSGGQGSDKTLSQDQVNAIVAREVAKAQRGKLDPKELGFESGKALQEFLDKQKEAAEAAKDEATKALEQAKKDAANQARSEVLTKANDRFIKAEFVVAANKAGVTSPTDAYVLAKTMPIWTQVELVEEGDDVSVKGFDDVFFEELKKEKAFLFPTAGGQGGGDLGGGAPNTDKAGKNRLSEDNLKEAYPALRNR